MKYLIVYNTCGIATNNNAGHYIKCLNTIFSQQDVEIDVAVSSCLNTQEVIDALKNEYGDKLRICWIHERVPVNVTFNHTAKTLGLNQGYAGIVYMDSGCSFRTPEDFARMVEVFENNPCGMVSSNVTTDPGIAVDHNFVQRTNLYQGRGLVLDNVISVGCSLNLHTQIFHHDLLEYYNGLMPDIFAGYCTESTFTFLCAALRKQWRFVPDVLVNHELNVDMQSSGFHPSRWMRETGRNNWDHPFAIETYMDRFHNETAAAVGMGFEECQRILIHDDAQFDDQEFCVNNQLGPWIKDNLFLKPEEFNYDKMRYEIV